MDVVLRDPTYRPNATPGLIGRIADGLICDKRDTPFLGLMALLSALMIPSGLVLFVPGAFRWWLGVVHLALFFYFVGPFILMLHNTSHRRLFRRPWGWMNLYIPWVLGPFFGESPETYFGHHVGMHHPENNLEDDLSSTMRYRRDSFFAFLHYFLSFFLFGLFDLTAYFARKRRRSLMIRVAAGELLFLAGVAALCWVNWRATLFVFVLPFVFARFGMMAGNWGQHAFLDGASPENNYRNSITCINSTYNRRCFNDGYHIGHHLKATRHWTEMPEDFQRNIATYDAEGALVFTGIDFFVVWAALMLKQYDWLARRLVPLGKEARPHSDLVALLRSRTQPIVREAPDAPGARSAA